MASRPKLADPIFELGSILPGDALERLQDLMADPGADHTLGQTARIGQALLELGNLLLDTAKEGMEARLTGMVGENARYSDSGVTFQWYPPTQQNRVNTDAAKSLFPRNEYPELYKKSDVKAKLTLTFSEFRS